ncbi:MAG: hypothetical protein ABSE73_23850 [Planctomycetota bacterium]
MRCKSLLIFSLALALGVLSANSAERGTVPLSANSGPKPDAVHAVMARYLSIPKGVVLEGTAEGFDKLESVTYNKDTNAFTINGKMQYMNPISRKEFAQVFKALLKDDRMGVTLIEGEPRVYGPLKADSDIVKQMMETDKLLGGILYDFEWLLEGVKLPGGYKPKRAANRTIPVVAFSRFVNFIFEKSADTYKLASCNLDVQLIPLSEKKTANGGHLPDLEKSKAYVMEPEDKENIEHLKTHQAEYLKIPAFAKTAATGEAAAFARLIRDTKLDSEELLKQIK